MNNPAAQIYIDKRSLALIKPDSLVATKEKGDVQPPEPIAFFGGFKNNLDFPFSIPKTSSRVLGVARWEQLSLFHPRIAGTDDSIAFASEAFRFAYGPTAPRRMPESNPPRRVRGSACFSAPRTS